MKALENECMDEHHPHYKQAISRRDALYQRKHDIRSPFSRDYSRLIFSPAYRRMKHKTQVFFAVDDDHVCTRSEHVNLVDSISYTIAKELGLNTELTKAIAVGHDLGHAPFGHGGEKILRSLAKDYGLPSFWHERNSLYLCDDLEVLEDDIHHLHNLDLTYAVRDGIISHCGEMRQRCTAGLEFMGIKIDEEKNKAREAREAVRKAHRDDVEAFAADNETLHQIVDLALLANGMLKGKALSDFIARSQSLLMQ